jgi:hypothetical protein
MSKGQGEADRDEGLVSFDGVACRGLDDGPWTAA